MSKNIFFERKGPFLLNDLFSNSHLKKKIKIFDIKTLKKASKYFEGKLHKSKKCKTKKLIK